MESEMISYFLPLSFSFFLRRVKQPHCNGMLRRFHAGVTVGAESPWLYIASVHLQRVGEPVGVEFWSNWQPVKVSNNNRSPTPNVGATARTLGDH